MDGRMEGGKDKAKNERKLQPSALEIVNQVGTKGPPILFQCSK